MELIKIFAIVAHILTPSGPEYVVFPQLLPTTEAECNAIREMLDSKAPPTMKVQESKCVVVFVPNSKES